ncbi:phosphatidate cytidylyltransferase [Nitrosomonas sp.]|uniref:phosphatidate cytidylyltransferase n=1 Tax=Nitrosomonas sp. TaxID=42353 RepID=UPI001E12CDA3|nr:phosphatidate cytidylyltransferase [Nitrosomonas sp.]MCB1949506.1 phosphatidate cytidylyltransferase [Nitrosomonas sp.]MCP5243758.1 phosphatidate cytidylyltransferase [Burkholderiales bacterium]MCP5292833.1 phosphatidate cytidylyltransferase [Burkholderiales bacterium]MDR4515098.1 phosphatidate cytidylyltransferase [Nitrosomonas sp.]
MLKARILTALIVLPLFLSALIYLQDIFWATLILILTVIGAREWCYLARFSVRNTVIFMVLTTLLGGELLFLLSEAVEASPYAPTAIWIYALSTLFWTGYVPWTLKKTAITNNTVILMVIGWLVLLPTALALYQLRAIDPLLLLGFMGTIWVSDTAAYFTGRAFGKHRLAYHISPGKTWEGVAGAMFAVMIYGFVWLYVFAEGAYLLSLVPLLIVLAILGIIGDLFESLVKRQAGVKDSGKILPGHGGILDRIDALTPSLPFAILAILLFNTFQS